MDPLLLVQISPDAQTPIYLQIVEGVKRRVANGTLQGGDEIPSVRTLATGLKVNAATISKAFSILEMQGVLVRRRGLTMMVAPLHQGQKPASEREALLRPTLQQAVAEAHQLGLPPAVALDLFKSLLSEQ